MVKRVRDGFPRPFVPGVKKAQNGVENDSKSTVFPVSRRGGGNKGGRKQMRANANKRRQKLTNASKRRGENASKRKQTLANVDKRKQTRTPPFIAVFYTPLCNPLSFSTIFDSFDSALTFCARGAERSWELISNFFDHLGPKGPNDPCIRQKFWQVLRHSTMILALLRRKACTSRQENSRPQGV